MRNFKGCLIVQSVTRLVTEDDIQSSLPVQLCQQVSYLTILDIEVHWHHHTSLRDITIIIPVICVRFENLWHGYSCGIVVFLSVLCEKLFCCAVTYWCWRWWRKVSLYWHRRHISTWTTTCCCGKVGCEFLKHILFYGNVATVCLSVCLSHQWATSKQLKMSNHTLQQSDVCSFMTPNFIWV